MTKIRIVVVEDSLTVRRRIVAALGVDPGLEVVAEAADGARAVELVTALRPDVVTMDMMLPGMTGLEAVEQIMGYCPTPILIVSASINRGELFKTYQALAAGAVDVLEKPRGDGSDGAWDACLRSALRMVSRIKVITHPRARLAQSIRPPYVPDSAAWTAPCRLVAIGASTGGPGALRELLRALPATYPLPIVVVLHMSTVFATALAEWLAGQCALPVRYATDGEAVPHRGEPGVVMAPPDRHLVIRNGRLRLTDDPERHSCRPSVDVLFESVAKEFGGAAVAMLLTGMGRDGAAGLLALRRAGALTIAQDEATSVVFGMPREAILLGAAARVLPLDQMAPTLVSLAVEALASP